VLKATLLVPDRQHRLPRWAVHDGDGQQVEWIEQHRIGSASATFFRAIAFHPDTDERVNLESTTDLSERLEQIEKFRQDPERFLGIHCPPPGWRTV